MGAMMFGNDVAALLAVTGKNAMDKHRAFVKEGFTVWMI